VGERNPWEKLTHDTILNVVESTIGEKLTNLLIPRNSYINRVFELELADNKQRIIVKFYRPQRWCKEMIEEELRLLNALHAAEIMVIPALKYRNKYLHQYEDMYFALFPKKGGRTMDELGKEEWQQVGRLMARMHNISSQISNSKRMVWRPAVATWQHVQVLEKTKVVPLNFKKIFFHTTEQIIEKFDSRFKEVEAFLMHGDCHLGNLIYRPGEGIYIIDFDDMCVAPAIQDLWMLLPDEVEKCENEIAWFVQGYQVFRDFPIQTLTLIPVLRAMRLIHFASWCAIQAKEVSFKNHFPDWGSTKYWNEKIKMLQKILLVH
jgi:Ser/Thr protein kinase RdoA (MazF antagonist)